MEIKLTVLFWTTCIVRLELLNTVAGLSLTFNRNNVVIGDTSTSDLVFTMTCSINEENDLKYLNCLRILKNNTTPQALASINPFEQNGAAKLLPDTSWSSRATVGGSYDLRNPRSTQLTLSMNASKLTCADGETYICEIGYTDQDSASKSGSDAETLAVIEQPKTPIQFSAQNMSAGGAQISGVGTESNPAMFMKGQMVKLTCTGQIGSNADALIVWRKTNYASGQLQDYSPGLDMQDDGTAGNLLNCQYTRTAWVQYNISSADMSRPTSSPLIFDCFIRDSRTSYSTPDEFRPRFYVRVYSEGPDPTGKTYSTGSTNAGLISGVIVGDVALLAVVVIVLFLVCKIRWRKTSTPPIISTQHVYYNNAKIQTPTGHNSQGSNTGDENAVNAAYIIQSEYSGLSQYVNADTPYDKLGAENAANSASQSEYTDLSQYVNDDAPYEELVSGAGRN